MFSIKFSAVIVYFFIINDYFMQTSFALTKCSSFKNVFGEFVERDRSHFNKTIDGCLERIKLDDKTIVEAYIRNQDIKNIGKDSVRNLIRLSTISFWGCTTEKISPGAFRNVPNLKTVQISYCKLKEVPKGKLLFTLVLEMTINSNIQRDK